MPDLEVNGRQHAVVRVCSLWVVEQLDVFEHVRSGGFPCLVCASSDPFAFQQLKEAFSNRVVMTVASSAHTGFKVMLVQERLPFPAAELRAVIGVHRNPVFRLSAPDSHQQGLQGEVRRHARLG